MDTFGRSRGKGVRARSKPRQQPGALCLGRTHCGVQHGQLFVSHLQSDDQTCTREQDRHLHQGAFGHALVGRGEWV